jgi:hypothetical protein
VISFNGGDLIGWQDNFYFNDTRVERVYFNDTQVYGPNTSFTTLVVNGISASFGLAPDSATFENTWVPRLRSIFADAFDDQRYTSGPGTDTVYRVLLARGYRMVTSDGTWGEGQYVNLYEGHSVTGANTSHNGGTSVVIQVAGDI